MSVASAEVFEDHLNGSNTASVVSNATDSQHVRLLIPSPHRLSGRLDVFLPAFVACVNLSRNYSRVRITFSASAERLLYLKTSNATVDVRPRCPPGTRVAVLTSGVYQCSMCLPAMFSGLVDSNDCRCV